MNKKIIPVAMAALLSQSVEGMTKPEICFSRSQNVMVCTVSIDSISSIEKFVMETIAHQLKIDKSKIQMKSDLIRDLGADSLDIVEIVMILENKYDCEFSDDELNGLKKVGDLVTVIGNKKKVIVNNKK